MSVDYSAEFGIGYRVSPSEDLPEGDIEDFESYLEAELDCGPFYSFSYGDTYQGEEWFCVVITKPFETTLNLELKRGQLLNKLNQMGVDVDGEFGEVGGLRVY